jgi:hypothetical protein
MKLQNALGIVLGVLGGFLAFLSLGPLHNVYFIWAVFIATATGVAIGGTTDAFKNLVVCGILGIVLAWGASLIVLNVPLAPVLGLPVWAAIVVGITTAFLAWAANLSFFPAIPATVVGYASTFAYLLQTPDKLSNAVLLSFDLGNPLIVMSISFLLAAAFGIVSLFIAKKMIAPPIAT